jgi:hypothetical protein
MIMAFNAESEESPWRNYEANIYHHKMPHKEGVKQFPQKKFGNNKDSPSYFRLPNIYENSLSSITPYNLINDDRNGPKQVLYKKVNNMDKKFKYQENNNGDLLEKLSQYTRKPTNIIKRNINMDPIPSSNSYNYSSLNLQEGGLIRNEDSTITKTPRIEMSLPKIKNSLYLHNINEYNIKETYKANEDRMIQLPLRHKESFNCVNNQDVSYSPSHVKVDKWPVFYEK